MDNNIDQNSEEQIKIKTICDFLFFDQYQDNASFLRFEKCFQPLFNNINISCEKVFNDICDTKKKYITYKRFAKAYLNFKNKKNLSEDTYKFFETLFNSILKKEKECVGGVKEKIYSFSTKTTSSKRNYITLVQILSLNDGEIHGINLEYDGGVAQCKIYPKQLENELDTSLEMKLDIIDEEKTIIANKRNFGLINKSNYFDGITHIFGTLNKETGYLTFIGFKCISGKTVYVGIPKGDGFLFGKFGYKFHDLKIQLNENGITRFEPGFKPNLRKNIFLDKMNEKLIYENLVENEIIKDEEYLDNLKDKNEIDKLKMTSIISDDYFFNQKLKDEFCGNDYKEVVDQSVRKWILKDDKKEEEEEKNITLHDALNKYNEEYEKTKEILKEYENSDLMEENSDLNDGIETPLDKSKKILENQGVYLHKTKKYKTKNKIKKSYNTEIRRSKLSLEKIGSKNNDENQYKSMIFVTKKKYENLQKSLGMMINDEIIENDEEDEDYIEKNEENDENDDNCKINMSKNTVIKMKNLKGEIINLGENNELDEIKKFKIAQNNWKNFKKTLIKINPVYILQVVGSIMKAKNVLDKKVNISVKDKKQLYDLFEKNKKIFHFLSNYQPKIKQKKEEKEEHIPLIPNLNPQKSSLSFLQKYLDGTKKLLKNQFLKEDERKKVEQLQNLYMQQKNILIENTTNAIKQELIENNNINVNKYIKNEEEKRSKAKEEEQKKMEEDLKKKKEIKENKMKRDIEKTYYKSFIARKLCTRIFHKQKMPIGSDIWTDEQFVPEKESLCPYDENGWIYFKDLTEDDVDGWEEYNWCRAEEITDFEDYEIFEDKASIEDIKQGDINDCYFLSAVGSLCNYPDFFDKLFHIKDRSEEHVYGIYFFINGKWKLVLIDDCFPYNLENYELKEFAFASSTQNELWVSLLEKAWAKVNGGYARIGCRGFSKEAFDVLTEAYTEQIDIRIFKRENREEELWKIIQTSFENNYVLTAGTYNARIVEVRGLIAGHDYTLINVYNIDNNIKIVKLKNPNGDCEYTGDWSNYSKKWTPELKEQCKYRTEDEEVGIFYMSYNDFLKYYEVIHIAKLESKPLYQTTYCKINKDKAIKCQIIRLIIEEDSPKTYIQLYQKNPRIVKKDGNHYPDESMAFIILVDKEYKYIKSVCGKERHLAIEIDLKVGTYYILTDVNYRNETKDNKNYGYMITFYAKNQFKNFKNVTQRIDVVSVLELAMYYYCKMKIKEIKDKSGIIVFDSEISNKEIPFRVFFFLNISKNPFKVKLDVKEKINKNFCIYNDRIASEFDNSVIKEIKAINGTTILILDYGKNEYDVNYEILPHDDIKTYENTHPVFNNKGENFDSDGNLISYYSKVPNDKGFTIGLENTSNIKYELKLKLNEIYNIDGDFKLKNNIDFEILPKSKKVFNLRIKPGAKDPRFEFKKE